MKEVELQYCSKKRRYLAGTHFKRSVTISMTPLETAGNSLHNDEILNGLFNPTLHSTFRIVGTEDHPLTYHSVNNIIFSINFTDLAMILSCFEAFSTEKMNNSTDFAVGGILDRWRHFKNKKCKHGRMEVQVVNSLIMLIVCT